MTQLSQKIIKCPNCGVENSILYYASINTFLDTDGNLISKLLDGTLNTSKCKNCGKKVRLAVDVLISAPKGMFYINPKNNIEYKKNKLQSYGVMSEKGVVLTGIVSQFKEVKKMLDEKKQYKTSSILPPAPKLTPHTKKYNELVEKLNRMLLKNKKTEEDGNSNSTTEKSKPPPPPPT
jgi:hypothetical protein